MIALWLPGYLDESSDGGYQLTDKSRPNLEASLVEAVSTHFPVRAFDGSSGARTTQPTRQAAPGTEPVQTSPGLPQRVVPGVSRVPSQSPSSPNSATTSKVTKRAWVTQQASVYSAPMTTANTIGTVEAGTRVRWAAQVGQGWEEIVMRDGRSVYMQAGTLSFTSPEAQAAKFNPPRHREEVDLAALPGAVNAFLANLSTGNILRASTHLAPTAPALEDDSLGALAPLVGGNPRLDRIESGPGRADRVVVIGDRGEPNLRVSTTWQWSSRQARWLLLGWR